MTALPDVLFFDHPEARRAALTGGKGANLSTLTSRGFAVPPGFVITGAGYQAFAGDLTGLPLDHPAEREALRQTLRTRPLPEPLSRQIHAALAQLAQPRVSVRSSSTLEDLDLSAFAGQHETYLGVVHADVLGRVRDCYLSLWEERAVLYRQARGFPLAEARMAVVVQTMVDAAAAGVAFTINPVSGALGELVIDANFGLGESVVAGEAVVDHHRIDKDSLALLESTIGSKERQVFMTASGVETREGQSTAAALAPAEVQAVARTALQIEASYGFPQDIEWAMDGQRKLWLLQTRPITVLPPRWTRDESAERFPHAMSPLGWEFADRGFHASLACSLRLMGWPPFPGKWFKTFDCYVYGNQNAVDLFLGKRATRRLPLGSLDELRRAVPTLAESYRWLLDLPARWAQGLDRYLLGAGKLAAEPLAGQPLPALWDHLLRLEALGLEYFGPNIAISMGHGLCHRALFQLLSLLRPPAQAKAAYDGLTGHAETKTALVNAELSGLAELVRGDPKLGAALAGLALGPGTDPARSFAPFPLFSARLARFLEDHGHRELDPDPLQPTWADAPWVVLAQLQALVAGSGPSDPRQRALTGQAEQAAMVREVTAEVPEDLRFVFGELWRLTMVYTVLDDLEHYQTTRLNPLFRRAVLALGEALAAKGAIAAADDLFFASRATLERAIADPSAAEPLRRETAEQRASFERAQQRSPAWTPEARSAPLAAAAEGDGLRGIPGAPGVAEGPVFIVRSPQDFPRFPKGAVLVARTTNPAWTPLFYSAAAVVTESGGPLSHGAVTAREMGLPAVMAVREALSRLATGARVRVDGDRGLVTVLPTA